MESKIAIIGIFVKKASSVEKVNEILHQYADKILGRMGLPHIDGVNVISVIIKACGDDINSLSGKLGAIDGVSAKAMQAKF